jgi:SpoVK/Ycf46/Vps4 family AAA+-type ATPase
MPRTEQVGHRLETAAFPFADGMEHLTHELRRLDLLIHLQVLNRRNIDSTDPLSRFRGVVLSEQEICGLLAEPEGMAIKGVTNGTLDRELFNLQQTLSEIEEEIRARRASAIQQDIFLPLPVLSDIFHLTPFEEQCLIICIAPELDRKYEKLYGYLHDDITRRQASIGLICDLLSLDFEEKVKALRFFVHSAPLLKYRLLRLVNESHDGYSSLHTRPVVIDERIMNFILSFPEIDNRLDSLAILISPETRLELVTLEEEAQSRLRGLVSSLFAAKEQAGKNLLLHFHGPYGTGKKSMAKAICHDLGLPLLTADLGRSGDAPLSMEELLGLIGREALLQHAALCLEGFDAFVAGENASARIRMLRETLQTFSRITFIFAAKPWQPREVMENEIFISLGFPVPDDGARKRFWERETGRERYGADGVDFGELAGKFRFTPGQVRDALRGAVNLAQWRSPAENSVTMEDLHTACRERSNRILSTLARKIEPRYRWNDIILPGDQLDQLREICNQARYRHIVYGDWGFERKLSYGKGLSVLFSGPPGTGKTMAAEVIANEIGLDLYKIDLSQVVSKYIGETEKNLDRIFQEAGTSNAILFFDEADALFGRRSDVKDAHDRYANIEIGYLLQKMEEYEGITILATNLRANMDEAFVRRMSFIVELPFPGVSERRAIWEGIWPEVAPLGEKLDLGYAANRYELTGGNIRNIALAAAFLAVENGGVIEMRHLAAATRREYQKMGKIIDESLFNQVGGTP